MIQNTDDALAALVTASARATDIAREFAHLREVEAWALKQLPFAEGDEVTLIRTLNLQKSSGWYVDREHLVMGATGKCKSIYFFRGIWRFYYEPDIEWRVFDNHGRKWEPGKHHLFSFDVYDARKRLPSDPGLALPDDATLWDHLKARS